MMYSGIDLHSNNSVVAVIDDGDRVVAQKRLPNDIGKITGFLARWQDELAGVVVESTYNWYWLVDGLQDAGLHVHLANTAAVKQYEGLKHSGDETDEAETQGGLPASGAGKPGHDRAPVSTVSLRDGGDAVIEALLQEIRARMEPIGVSVLEARISHLAYSSEIAGAMLRKQAASAVVAARRMIVRGAVSIVEDALEELDRKKLADALDPERKAAMISNLLVVLVGDREVTPVINTGTLYS